MIIFRLHQVVAKQSHFNLVNRVPYHFNASYSVYHLCGGVDHSYCTLRLSETAGLCKHTPDTTNGVLLWERSHDHVHIPPHRPHVW